MSATGTVETVDPAGVAAEAGAGDRRVEFNAALGCLWMALMSVAARFAPGLLVFLGVLSVLVVVHEGAHLAAARRAGMFCEEFAVGFGPKVCSVRVGEMWWSWRLLPVGGFVNIVGMSHRSEVAPELEARTFRAGSLRARLGVLAAGPVSNLVAAFVLLVGALWVQGVPSPVPAAFEFTTQSVAESFSGYAQLVGSLGEYPAALASAGEAGEPVRAMSPVSGSQFAAAAAEMGLAWLMLFAAAVSVALGAFNLLPIAPLDGGHMAVAVWEAAASRLRGRAVRVPVRLLNGVALSVVGFLVLLSGASMYLDVVAPVASPFGG